MCTCRSRSAARAPAAEQRVRDVAGVVQAGRRPQPLLRRRHRAAQPRGVRAQAGTHTHTTIKQYSGEM